nr:GNAT family N-acetyltransferase [Mammaliicoccus sp. Marseille-Q6498]
MNFEVVTSIDDPLFKHALDMYEDIFKVDIREDRHVFIHSLTSEYIKKHYVFLVGLKDNKVVSLSTGHYEPTTNSAFIIYLMVHPEHRNQRVGAQTLERIEKELHKQAQEVHGRDANMIMLESFGEESFDDEDGKEQAIMLKHFFNRHGYEVQQDLSYIQPNPQKNLPPTPIDLYIKQYLPLQKDVISPSIRSCYINKYIHGNENDREFVYELLESMNL